MGEAGLGRLAEGAGLAVLGGDPTVLQDVPEDRGGVEREAGEGGFAGAVAEGGIAGEVGGAVIVLKDAAARRRLHEPAPVWERQPLPKA